MLGVEVDARMAAVARAKGLEVEISPFESWEVGERRFDLVMSTQAWHRVDPRAGVAKAAVALAERGRIGRRGAAHQRRGAAHQRRGTAHHRRAR